MTAVVAGGDGAGSCVVIAAIFFVFEIRDQEVY